MKTRHAIFLALAATAWGASAQTIERMKLSDGDLSCQQLFDEVKMLDMLIAQAGSQPAAAAPAAPGNDAASQVAGAVAQQAAAKASVRLGGFLGGGSGGLFGGVGASVPLGGLFGGGSQQPAAPAAASGNPALAQQAAGRKEHLTGLFLGKNCQVAALSGQAATGATTATAPAAVSVAAPVMPAAPVAALPVRPLPELKFNVEEVNPEDLLDSNKTLLVPTAYVTVLVAGRVGATQQSGMFQSGQATARSSVSYAVTGWDKAYMQGLAQQAQDDFVTKLRASGYKVLTYADVKDRDVVRSMPRETETGPAGLPTKNDQGQMYVVATPSDEQQFKASLGGRVDSFTRYGKTQITDATVVIPYYTVHAPQVWGETSRGYKSVSANVNTAPGMNLFFAEAVWHGQPKSRMMRGIPGVRTKQQVINATEAAGTLRETANTTPHAANALSAGLAGLGGGNIQSQSRQMEFVIDRAAYTAGVMNGIGGFNAEVARVAANAKP